MVVCHVGGWVYSYYIVLIYYRVAWVNHEIVILAFAQDLFSCQYFNSVSDIEGNTDR